MSWWAWVLIGLVVAAALVTLWAIETWREIHDGGDE
jgi:hypothetical protein